ncbi:M61 family metallopeptidase [Mucilaginibacter rivuli]|uniref:M61 family metallopeptidase n=1 Tax=Mucilaginibacter rivuli TaxID=2857527 RepID=UPI002102AB99|nr:PDZ domain-containing protein [Mucilaginibacter rivuli]
MSVNAIPVTAAVPVNYNVTFPEAQAHYVNIEMNLTGLHQQEIDVKMPVWTPGSYLIREFGKNVEGFVASSNGTTLTTYKTDKNTWRVVNGAYTNIKISYRVYCFEISVRTSFVDAAHGFLSTSGLFMYPVGMLDLPSQIHIEPYKNWTTVSTSLEHVNGNQFTLSAPNYDILFDSPIEVGTQDVFDFDVDGVHYQVAMVNGGNYNKEDLKRDFTKVVQEEVAVFGENPNKRYVFIVHNYTKGGGGLEHLSSTVLGASRDNYATRGGYENFLALAAHEHFHVWNVKRLRPIALGPFDYDKENYTTNLWIAEGFTSYYQDIIIRRTHLYPVDDYLARLANNITTVTNQPGAKIESLNDASFNAWIKLYRPNENSTNSTISYYSKGGIVAMMLDLMIINNTKGEKSLDDVMRYMYNEYYKIKNRGYTDAEFKTALEKFAGKNLDDFYNKYIYGVADLDCNKYLAYAGYKLTDDNAGKTTITLGATVVKANGKYIVTAVARNSAAWIDGINVNDELAAIDGLLLTNEPDKVLALKKPGDKVVITAVRDGIVKNLPVTLLKSNLVKYHIEDIGIPSEANIVVRKKWLKL